MFVPIAVDQQVRKAIAGEALGEKDRNTLIRWRIDALAKREDHIWPVNTAKRNG